MVSATRVVLPKLFMGVCLVCATTIIHAVFMVTGVRWAHRHDDRRGEYRNSYSKALSVSLFTAWMFLGTVAEVLLWAGFYWFHPAITAFPNFETATYFSMVTFTAVGYGDVVITGPWRILAGVEAANGVIIFGWTTALLFYFIQQTYKSQ